MSRNQKSGGHIEYFDPSLSKLFFWKTEARFSEKKVTRRQKVAQRKYRFDHAEGVYFVCRTCHGAH